MFLSIWSTSLSMIHRLMSTCEKTHFFSFEYFLQFLCFYFFNVLPHKSQWIFGLLLEKINGKRRIAWIHTRCLLSHHFKIQLNSFRFDFLFNSVHYKNSVSARVHSVLKISKWWIKDFVGNDLCFLKNYWFPNIIIVFDQSSVQVNSRFDFQLVYIFFSTFLTCAFRFSAICFDFVYF